MILKTQKIRAITAHYFDLFVNSPFQRQHINLLEQEIIGSCETLLDIGCGDGAHIMGCAPHLKKSIGIDIFPPAIARARERGLYSQTILMNADKISGCFEEHSFDCVLAFDLLEHLKKSDGLSLLSAMEKIASKKVIVFTPNGFLPQSTINGNVHQIHRSGWTTSEMQTRGYRVCGVHGIKGILGEESLPRWRPTRLWKLVTVLIQPFFLNIPRLAFQIFCVKTIMAPR
ncbi:MAG: class I SAM-dependent methyltransferase [Syntrophales bacterium]|nr:class I SAM-dependent methyltransferase [Syntrophales bacterium]